MEVKLKEGRREPALIFINSGASVTTTECLLKGLSVWYPLLINLSFLPSYKHEQVAALEPSSLGLWKRRYKAKSFLLKPIFYSLSEFLPPTITTYCMEWVWCWDDRAGPLFATSGKDGWWSLEHLCGLPPCLTAYYWSWGLSQIPNQPQKHYSTPSPT